MHYPPVQLVGSEESDVVSLIPTGELSRMRVEVRKRDE